MKTLEKLIHYVGRWNAILSVNPNVGPWQVRRWLREMEQTAKNLTLDLDQEMFDQERLDKESMKEL